MSEVIDQFFNLLVEHNEKYHSIQPSAIFNSAKKSLKDNEGMVLDFFNFLFTHGIIRMGLNFSNAEFPFMTFTKFGETLITNKSRRIAIIEEFLKIYNSS